jgi:hypothetical protein
VWRDKLEAFADAYAGTVCLDKGKSTNVWAGFPLKGVGKIKDAHWLFQRSLLEVSNCSF